MKSTPLVPEVFNSAVASISSSVTWQNNFLLPPLILFWWTFPSSTFITENPRVAKQLLLITRVRWDESHLERVNSFSRRKSWGSAGTSTLPSQCLIHFPVPPTIWFITSGCEGSPCQLPVFVPSSSHSRATPQGCPHSLYSHIPLSALPAASISTQEQDSTTSFHLVIVIGFSPTLHLKLMKVRIYLEWKTESILTLIWLRHLEMCDSLMDI